MPTTNSDSSERTRQKRAMALYAFNNQLVQANSKSGFTSVRREQVNTQTLDVATERKQGGCYCSNLASGIYNFRGGCTCSNN
jgi:hypothetical protein